MYGRDLGDVHCKNCKDLEPPIPDGERDHQRPQGYHVSHGALAGGPLGPSAEFLMNLETSYQLHKEGEPDPEITVRA